jgi:ribosomal protein S18 acetylase RimI-like enzyme
VLVTNAYDRLIQYIDARVHTLLIATNGTQRVAFAIVIRDLPDEVTGTEQAFIAYMAVEPAYQRQGIASALLRAAEEVAIADGLPFISLMVTEDNAAARRLYERAGFATERRMMTKELQ